MYSQLMVAARKAESKTEDTKERVRAWSSAATEVSDGSKQLGDQIAWLMTALNRAEQGTCPTSAPSSPRHKGHGRGQTDRNTPVHPSSHNGWTALGQNTSTCSSSAASRVTTASQRREVPKHQQVYRAMPKTQRTPALCNVSSARAGVIWQGSMRLHQNS